MADSEKNNMEEEKAGFSLTPWILLAITIYIGFSNPSGLINIMVVLIGFGMVVFVHEMGHFLAAKAVGITTEEFAVGFGTPLFRMKKLKEGLQFRILPKDINEYNEKELFKFMIPTKSDRVGTTNYQLRAIPLGGFVKMMGQEDLVATESSNDPGSYMNKPVWQRMIVISAGVIVNIITGFMVFMYLFYQGIPLQPAIAGNVLPESPAMVAGIQPGDEIIEIDGKKNITMMHLRLASALAEDSIDLKVKRADNSVETISVTPEFKETFGIKLMGVEGPQSLQLVKKGQLQGEDSDEIINKLKELGLEPGDKIIAANEKPISLSYELDNIIKPKPGESNLSQATITYQRKSGDNLNTGNITIDLHQQVTNNKLKEVFGIAPLMRINMLTPDYPGKKAGLLIGDLIKKIGNIENPTLDEFTDYTKNHPEDLIDITVLRKENDAYSEKTFSVKPFREEPSLRFFKQINGEESTPKIGVVLNQTLIQRPLTEPPIVAKTFEIKTKTDKTDNKAGDDQKENPSTPALKIPRGALITHVAKTPVENWGDIVQQLKSHQGKSVALAYQIQDNQTAEIELAIPADYTPELAYRPVSDFVSNELPSLLKPYEKVYKADSLFHSLMMGADYTITWIGSTYFQLKSMITGQISLKSASGPVGIIRMSYKIVDEKPLSFYLYFMAILSMGIAVFNFLPLPILDGGHFVLLIVEKIKGSPVSVKVQEMLTYAGLLFIGGFFLYVTYNDIYKLITGAM